MKVWITRDYRDLARMMLAGVIPGKEAQNLLDVSHPMSCNSKTGYFEEVMEAKQETKQEGLKKWRTPPASPEKGGGRKKEVEDEGEISRKK